MAKKKNNLYGKVEHETRAKFKKTSQSKHRPKKSSMNKHKIYIKFDCIESTIIIPKEKPKKNTQPKVETSYQI